MTKPSTLLAAAMLAATFASPAMAQSSGSSRGGDGSYTSWNQLGGSSRGADGSYTSWSGPAQVIMGPNGPSLIIPQQ